MVDCVLKNECFKGIVIASYGQGLIPVMSWNLEALIIHAVQRGAVVVNVNQDYVTSYNQKQKERDDCMTRLGVVNCRDMTLPCAVAKLGYLLGKKSLSVA